MEKKDVIYRLVKGFDLSFETSEDVLCLRSCADLSILQGGGHGGSFLSVLACPALRDVTAAASLPHRLRGRRCGGGSCAWVNVKPCISSGADGAKGPCFSFCMPLVPSYLLGFLSACGSDSLRYNVIYSLNIFNYHHPSSLAIIF